MLAPNLKSLALDLFATGRYGSRREAEAAAVAQLKRERERRDAAKSAAPQLGTITFTIS